MRVGTGELLAEVMRLAKPEGYPLEGSLLGFIYNPVHISGPGGEPIRAWGDFAMGSGAGIVHEDRFQAQSEFEFRAFERPGAVDVLYAIKQAGIQAAELRWELVWRAVLDAQAAWARGDRLGGYSYSPAGGLDSMVYAWQQVRAVSERRTQAGRHWPRSFDELRSWLEFDNVCRSPGYPESPDLIPFYQVLGQLASRRFRGQ